MYELFAIGAAGEKKYGLDKAGVLMHSTSKIKEK